MFGDRVYVSGGSDDQDRILDSVVVGSFGADGNVAFEPVAAKLSLPRMHIHQTPVWKQWMFFVGGRDENDASVGVIDIGTFE
jgi:hypothetical protein